MADRSRSDDPRGPHARLGVMRERDGIVRVWATCERPGCHHTGNLDVSGWPPDTLMPDVARRLVCSRCGQRRWARIVPDWRDAQAVQQAERRAELGYGPRT